jgi:hypothetical protein
MVEVTAAILNIKTIERQQLAVLGQAFSGK